MGDYPMVIRSFIHSFREERKDYAQRDITLITPLGPGMSRMSLTQGFLRTRAQGLVTVHTAGCSTLLLVDPVMMRCTVYPGRWRVGYSLKGC